MAKIKLVIENKSSCDLRIATWSTYVKNWTGNQLRTVPKNATRNAAAERDESFSTLLYKSTIQLEFWLKDPLVLKDGPLTTSWPVCHVGSVHLSDATLGSWVLDSARTLAMDHPYRQLRLNVAVPKNVATVTIQDH